MLSGILVAASCHATSMASRAGLCCAPSSSILPLPLDTWKWLRLGPFPASSDGFLPSVAPKNNSRPRRLPLCASLPFALALCLSPSLVKRGSVGWVGYAMSLFKASSTQRCPRRDPTLSAYRNLWNQIGSFVSKKICFSCYPSIVPSIFRSSETLS